MRRKDREVTDLKQIETIIKDSKILHLGLMDEGYPYIIPLHYGYEYIEDKLIFYMHGAKEGHKMDLIKKNGNACIQLDNNVAPVSGGDIPCNYATIYSSVIAKGQIERITDPSEKIHALNKLMLQQTGRAFEINERMAESVAVLRFTADSFTAKARFM